MVKVTKHQVSTTFPILKSKHEVSTTFPILKSSTETVDKQKDYYTYFLNSANRRLECPFQSLKVYEFKTSIAHTVQDIPNALLLLPLFPFCLSLRYWKRVSFQHSLSASTITLCKSAQHEHHQQLFLKRHPWLLCMKGLYGCPCLKVSLALGGGGEGGVLSWECCFSPACNIKYSNISVVITSQNKFEQL